MVLDKTCSWCGGDCGAQTFYEGQVLLIHREEAEWELRRWCPDGMGSGALELALDLLPDWAADIEVGVAARASAAVMHEDGNVIDWQEPPVGCCRASIKRAGKKWKFLAGPLSVVTSPGNFATAQQEQNWLERAKVWIAEDREVQFEDARTYLAQKEQQKAEGALEEEGRRWREARRKLVTRGSNGAYAEPGSFVNPFTFVPLAKGPERSAPTTHLGLGGQRRSGTIQVTMTARTKLALGTVGSGKEDDPVKPLWDDANGRWYVPGSNFAGSVRAFHEALTDSCLRIVDLGFVPIHRDPPTPPGYTNMGVVEDTPDGLRIRLLESGARGSKSHAAMWVRKRNVTQHLNTADRYHLDFDGHGTQVVGDRLVFEHPLTVSPCTAAVCSQDHWRTIVAEPIGNRTGDRHWLPFAKEDRSAVLVAVPKETLRAYEAAAHGARDVVKVRRGETVTLLVPRVGTRAQVHPTLHDGDLMWVKVEGATVSRIAPSVLWRSPGKVPVKDRIVGYEPCTDPESLCPSCALFGMIHERDESAKEDHRASKAVLAAYRGHVRFGNLHFSELDKKATTLIEMGSPRPGSGQLYLENGPDAARKQARSRTERPYREWGSRPDDGTPRQIAGRKRWWPIAEANSNRHEAGERSNMTCDQRLTSENTEVSSTVWFDNLTEAQLGALIVSISPGVLVTDGVKEVVARLVAGNRDHEAHWNELIDEPGGFVARIGKGKGVGLGAVSVDLALGAWGSDRYLNPRSATADMDTTRYVLAFLEELGRSPRWDDQARDRILGLLSTAALNWVPPERVTYPPDDVPRASPKFDFWKKSTGASGNVDNHPAVLVTQPKPHEPDVTIKRDWLLPGRG